MGQTGGALQDRAGLTLRKLARHDIRRWALTGGLAIERRAPRPEPRPLHDLDLVAPDFDSLPASLARDFLFRHVHPLDPPGKIILQFAHPETKLRIDVFRACGGTLDRASVIDFEFGSLSVVSAEDLLARHARLLLDLAVSVPVPRKHAAAYLRLADFAKAASMETVWRDHRRPSHPAEFHAADELVRASIRAHPELLVTPVYKRNSAAVCPRCRPVTAFPLADPDAILALWGYC